MLKTPDTDALITVAEAARHLGINKSTLHRQVRARKVRSHGGLVRIAEVVKDRERNLHPGMRPLSGPTSRRAVARRRDQEAALRDHEDSRPDLGAEVEAAEWFVLTSLAFDDRDPIELNHCDVTCPRDDARALAVAYRAVYVALNRGEDHEAPLAALDMLRTRLGVPAD